MTVLPGRHDVAAVLELWKLHACIVLQHGDRPGTDPKAPKRKWGLRRAPLNTIEPHTGGYGMALAVKIHRRWEFLSVVDVDETDRSEADTRALIEQLAGGPAAAWIKSVQRGWHAVFAALPGAKSHHAFQLDGIRGEVLTGRKACVSLWDPRAMIPAVHAIRKGTVVMFDPECLPPRPVASPQGPASSPAPPDVRHALPLHSDLFLGAVGPRRTVGVRWPVDVTDEGRVLVGYRANDLFDQVRAFAYPLPLNCTNHLQFEALVREFADRRTENMHAEPLPDGELATTVRSVCSWTWERRSALAGWAPGHRAPNPPRDWQVWRGEQSGKKRRDASAPRAEEVVRLARLGLSQRAIADATGLSKSGVVHIIDRDLRS